VGLWVFAMAHCLQGKILGVISTLFLNLQWQHPLEGDNSIEQVRLEDVVVVVRFVETDTGSGKELNVSVCGA
jgi:hypothetical protein